MQDQRLQIETAIPCVHYDDFLALTLPHNRTVLRSCTVLTSPRDTATLSLAESMGVPVFLTDAWHRQGTFNKGLALNEWLAHTANTSPRAWRMVLDADILLPRAFSPDLASLDSKGIYGAHRRLCETPALFGEFLNGRRTARDFPLDVAPVVNGMLWGNLQTRNSAALSGYLQLWCPAGAAGMHSFPETGTAGAYDVIFGLSFPEQARAYLEPWEVLHLGPSRVNWNSRRSPRWELRSGQPAGTAEVR